MKTPLSIVLLVLSAATIGCGESVTLTDAGTDARAPDVAKVARDVTTGASDVVTDTSAPAFVCPGADAGAPVDVDLSALARSAAERANLTQPVVRRSRAWLTEELNHIDPTSGLLIDALNPAAAWTTQDTAADIYPYLVWSAYLLNPSAFTGQSRRALDFERSRTVVPASGSLAYSFDTRTQSRIDWGAFWLIFGSGEYVKDGLTPIVELVGRGPWADRMQELELDSFRYGQWNTPAGTLPWDNLELSGDHMQSLPRLYAMTRDPRYRDYAERIAQHYLVNDNYRPANLRDHSCEIIGGFALLYAVERQENAPVAARYEVLLRNMIDHIVTYGLTAEGLMPDTIDTNVRSPVPAARGTLSDNWGQNYVAFLIYAQYANQPRYYEYIDRALRSLGDPAFDDYPWQDTNIDGLADSVEGAIYLLAYRDVPEAERWLDAQVAHLAARPWGADKYGANSNRTALLYVRARTRGTWVWPARDDVAWGAAQARNSVVVSVRAEGAWEGRVTFDSPRYRDTLGFACDYPRMNYMPAYFVADPMACYRVTRLNGSATPEEVTGARLIEGYALSVPAGGRVDLAVERVACRP